MQSDATAPSFHGFVKDHYDALLLITAARLGFIPRFRRRLNMTEQRALICSGSIFLWTEEESYMKRWTDGYPWSPSRVHNDFLLYREMVERGCARSRTSSRLAQNDTVDEDMKLYDDRRRKAIRVLAGSLFNSREFEDLVQYSTSGGARANDVFKRGGLMKKTFSLSLPGETWHLVSYYTLEDVLASLLPMPKESPFFEGIGIPEDVQDTHALSMKLKSQSAEPCIENFMENSPSPSLLLEFDPQVTRACHPSTVSESRDTAFSADEWHRRSTANVTFVDDHLSMYGASPSPTYPYPPSFDGRRQHTTSHPATGWYTFS